MRKMAAHLLLCAALATASSCATTSTPSIYTNQLNDYSDLRVGMTQAEVLKVMGERPVKVELIDGGSRQKWHYCATQAATGISDFVFLTFEPWTLSSIEAAVRSARFDGGIVDCATYIMQGYSNVTAASRQAAAKERAEAKAKAERKEVRQRRTAAAAAALSAGAAAMSESMASEAAPPQNQSSTRLLLYADNQERTFLGCLNCNQYDTASVFNQYGSYGSEYSVTSIRNQHSQFGSRYSNVSACNPQASNPPLILDDAGDYYGRLTVNQYATDANRQDEVQRIVRLLCAH